MSLKPFQATATADEVGSEAQVLTNYTYNISANGISVGTLQSFSPSNTRAVERLREIRGDATSGIQDVLGVYPGGDDPTFRATRVQLYTQNLLQAFGLGSIKSLNEITTPIDVEEIATSSDGQTETVIYSKCLPTSLSKTVTVGTVLVTEEASFAVTEILPG